MKKILLILACLLFITPSVYAADVFLIWDAPTTTVAVDLYQVEMDGQIVADVIPGTYHTLVNLVEGAHIARVRAHCLWGWGPFSPPLDIDKELPGAPTNLRLEIQ